MKKHFNITDLIITLILVILVIVMILFTASRNTGNQEILLMEVYKSAGPNTSTDSTEHYYIYSNTNIIKIRSSETSNAPQTKEINQDLIDNFKQSLDEYISKNVSMNSVFNINEHYTIEYNGKIVVVPNPSVATLLGYNGNDYTFYHSIDNFINGIKNQ